MHMKSDNNSMWWGSCSSQLPEEVGAFTSLPDLHLHSLLQKLRQKPEPFSDGGT